MKVVVKHTAQADWFFDIMPQRKLVLTYINICRDWIYTGNTNLLKPTWGNLLLPHLLKYIKIRINYANNNI